MTARIASSPTRSATITRREGPTDAVPTADVSIAVALADKLDQLVGFFAIGEKPTGAGDPFALRRAALGIIRIIRENRLRLDLLPLIELAGHGWHHHGVHPVPPQEILDFLAERLRVQLRAEGARHDVLAAVFAAGADDDITRLLARTDAVAALLGWRRRRQPAHRLSPRRQHPPHRGPQGRPARRRTRIEALLRGRRRPPWIVNCAARNREYDSPHWSSMRNSRRQ